MAATIHSVRYQIRDLKEPYTFPDEIIQEALDAAADFIYRKYSQQGSLANSMVSSNDPSVLKIQNGVYGGGRGITWVDYWLQNQYTVDLNTPTGAKLQKLMAAVDLMSSLLLPTSDRTPTGVSEGGLSIQWGGAYEAAIEKWEVQIEKLMFALEPPMFCVYDNF